MFLFFSSCFFLPAMCPSFLYPMPSYHPRLPFLPSSAFPSLSLPQLPSPFPLGEASVFIYAKWVRSWLYFRARCSFWLTCSCCSSHFCPLTLYVAFSNPFSKVNKAPSLPLLTCLSLHLEYDPGTTTNTNLLQLLGLSVRWGGCAMMRLKNEKKNDCVYASSLFASLSANPWVIKETPINIRW